MIGFIVVRLCIWFLFSYIWVHSVGACTLSCWPKEIMYTLNDNKSVTHNRINVNVNDYNGQY